MLYIINQIAKVLRFYWIFFDYCFLRDIHEAYLSLKDADDEQSKLANKLKSIKI